MEGDLPFYYDPASLHVNKHHDILASCSQIYEVARCPTSQGDVPMLEWAESLRLADSGKVNVKASSDLVSVVTGLLLVFLARLPVYARS